MSEEELDKRVEGQKSINIQAGKLNLHYVPGKHGLNRASLRVCNFGLNLGTVNT